MHQNLALIPRQLNYDKISFVVLFQATTLPTVPQALTVHCIFIKPIREKQIHVTSCRSKIFIQATTFISFLPIFVIDRFNEISTDSIALEVDEALNKVFRNFRGWSKTRL